ncbi:cilia- and flagella-associated protein 54 [Diretmus argenteus]
MGTERDLPASYYGELDRRNPVISAFEREISSFVTLIKQVTPSNSGRDNSSYARGVKMLVEIWSRYKHLLPSQLYQEHVLRIADYLFGIKLYPLALWQGYSLSLQQFSSVSITDITDVDHFMGCFFPEGFDTNQDMLDKKLRALQGCFLCVFEQEKKHNILSQEGLCRLLRLLDFIRIMMQAIQRHEHLCWQLYNGSLHIYNICRYLMTMNCSAQALEYLLWASISVEMSIPLMTVQYLPWVVTLYCAVCQCYYDNQAAVQAEVFARRALGKINDRAKLEEQSETAATTDTQRAYKAATIKLATMVFKRAAYESGGRPKSPLRRRRREERRAKGNLKNMPNVPRPPSPTGRMLKELFDSSAAQFLGILEALGDSTRRPLQTGVPESPTLLLIVRELLSAGIRGGSAGERGRDDCPSMCLSTLTPESTLMESAIKGENKVSFMSAVKFIKLLFHYEESDVFTALASQMLQMLPDVEGQSFRKAERELALLDSFNTLKQSLRDDSTITERKKFIGLVDTLHTSVCGSAPVSEVQPDRDLVLDLVLFLWSKIKGVFQKAELQHWEPKHDLRELEHRHEWVWCLSTLCEVAFVCDLVTDDCIAVAEMTLRLAMVLENAADSNTHTHSTAASEAGGVRPGPSYPLERSSAALLQDVCEVVERGVEALARGWAGLLPQDGSVITDSTYLQKFKPLPSSTYPTSPPASSGDRDGEDRKGVRAEEEEEDQQETKAGPEVKRSSPTMSTRLTLLAADLHLELVTIHHRASLKLLQYNPVSTDSELLGRVKKNKVSKALFLIQKSLLAHDNMEPNSSCTTKRLLEEAVVLIEKAGVEERRLYNSITSPAENKDRGKEQEKEKPPPPPILLSRTKHSLTFAPAPYHMEGQVCWYQICGRAADSINLKVRLGDCTLSGTGTVVPAVSGQCELRVEGLEPNQKYVFAVAAYNSQGKLVGNTIGETTCPLLASMPLPLLTAWAHLAQAAFQTKQYAVAKRACGELWSHYTFPKPASHSRQHSLALTGLRVHTLQRSSPLLLQLFLTSIFIGTEINVQQGALYCDALSDNGPLIWGQEARLAECECMLVAMDLSMWLNHSGFALQAAVCCYGLLAPLIFHQIISDQVVQVLTKCLVILEENVALLKQKRTGDTSESLMHMTACITYYLSKTLRVLREPRRASMVMDRGGRLLQQIYEALLQLGTVVSETEMIMARRLGKLELFEAAKDKKKKMSLQLRALHGATSTWDSERPHPHELTLHRDPITFYNLIANSTLETAYEEVMKLKSKVCFIEFAALLLQRTVEEDLPGLVIQWGQDIFALLSRRHKSLGLFVKHLQKKLPRMLRRDDPKGNELPKKKKQFSNKKTIKNALQRREKGEESDREMQVVENMLTLLSFRMVCHRQRVQLRNVCSLESLWKSNLNHSLAQAHTTLLHKGLEQLHGAALQDSYSHFNPLSFSLAHSGVLVRGKNSQQQQQSPEHEFVSLSQSRATPDEEKEEAVGVSDEDSATVEGCEGVEDLAMQHPNVQDSLNKAALHFRRAMVLAHRGGHWTTLQCVCRTLWEQGCRITALVERAAQLDAPSPITVGQLRNTLTPLLVLATDLLMDMLNRLQLWSVYDSDVSDEDLEASLHFSAPVDDSTQVDLRWVRTLVLYTLELLHDTAKWETLAHFALLFNSHTRERYTLIVTPLLVHAQRKLLDRIRSFGGPPVPQPHHVKTQKATGKEITCRSYASCQLLSGWTPPLKASSKLNNSSPLQMPTDNNPQLTNPTDAVELQGAEIRRSMSLVCVPLDVEDTLLCYRQALERRPRSLQSFQQSHSLLLLLLAHTQPGFSPIVMSAPELQDPTDEDYSTLKALYSSPISPNHIHAVITSYSTTISKKYLKADNHNSLRVRTLHDIGNLQFYNGNTRAAHSYWRKAVDCALLSSGVLEKWDGVSWGGDSPQHTLKHAGIWGCLQAAVLTAKIAQYILTSEISQRTKCCLLSAHLFKCVLRCSLAHPQCDLQYASHSIGDELLPGVDLFSEPHRVHLGTTVASLNFLCYWLYTAGHYTTLLPMLALYLHFVGPVCRDVQRTVEGKILKIRALTELSLFTQAIKEAVQLMQGQGVLLPHGHHISIDNPARKFYSNKSLLGNAQALEDLVNCDLAPEVHRLYGSTLCHRCNLARIQLVLALSSTIHSLPLAGSPEDETHVNIKAGKEPKVLVLDSLKEKLTPETTKFLLLEGAFHLLVSSSQQYLTQSQSETEDLELTIEANLLIADLYLQQGFAALSSDMAVSALVLLQSPVMRSCPSSSSQKPKSPPLPHTRPGSEQCRRDPYAVFSPLHVPGDCPRAVEAGERTGAALWLRCRLALVRSMVANIPSTAIFPGLEAVSLLSGRTCMPPGSSVTLARASLLLSDLRGTHNTTLLELTQKLLQQQLCVFGQSVVVLEDGKVCLPPSGPSNIYLSHLPLLAKTTMRIGLILSLKAVERPFSAQSPEIPPGQSSLQSSSRTETDFQSSGPSLSHLNSSHSTSPPMLSPFQIPRFAPSPDVVRAWQDAHGVLHSALTLSQSCAFRDVQLEADLLYCRGIVQRSLRYLSKVNRQEVAETFLECIQTTMRHCHNLPVLHNCYLEVALLFLHDWQHTPHKPPTPQSQNKISPWKRLLTSLNRGLTATEGYLLLFWIYLRGAAMVSKAMSGCGRLCGAEAGGEALSETSLKALPNFAFNDLLHPRGAGGVCQLSQDSTPEKEQSFRAVSRKHSQVTWVHMARYYTHLLNLQQTANKPMCPQTAEGLASLSGDVSLALRLSQLHSFFCSHMSNYRENCCAPAPAPAEIMLLPQIVQLSPMVRAALGQVEEVYRWSVSTKQQLCIQWHQPALCPTPGYQDIAEGSPCRAV